MLALIVKNSPVETTVCVFCSVLNDSNVPNLRRSTARSGPCKVALLSMDCFHRGMFLKLGFAYAFFFSHDALCHENC